MNKWLTSLISTIIFFGVYLLLEYFFSESIDWKMVIISTVLFGVLESFCEIYKNKKK